MGHSRCHDCKTLEDYYRLKLSAYLSAAKSGHSVDLESRADPSEAIRRHREEALTAVRALLEHWRECEQRLRYHAEQRPSSDQLPLWLLDWIS